MGITASRRTPRSVPTKSATKGVAGRPSTWAVSPSSTISPWLSTATRWAMDRTSGRLWVMNSIDRPRSRCRLPSSSTIAAWTLTSSAEVTSSQISTLGSQTRARAIATRWRSPPDS